jgi:hypothetical protein
MLKFNVKNGSKIDAIKLCYKIVIFLIYRDPIYFNLSLPISILKVH